MDAGRVRTIFLILLAFCLSACGQAVRNLNGFATNATLLGNTRIGTGNLITNGQVVGVLSASGVISGNGAGLTNLPASSGPWTESSGVITPTFQTNRVEIQRPLVIGTNTLTWWGVPTSEILLGYRDRVAGEPNLSGLSVGVVSNDAYAQLDVGITISSVIANHYMVDDNGNEASVEVGASLSGGPVVVGVDTNGSIFRISPSLASPPPYFFSSAAAFTAGDVLFALANFRTNKFTVTGSGLATATNGFASGASDAAVTIAATGYTNTFGKNAIVHFDGVSMFFTNVLRGSVPWYTNTTAHSGTMTVTLQPGEAVRIAGTSVVGRAKAF